MRKLFLLGGVLIGAVAASLFAISANADAPPARDGGAHLGVAFIGMLGGLVGGGLGAILGRLVSKRPNT